MTRTASYARSQPPPRIASSDALRVTPYDRVVSMVYALLIVVGALVFVLLVAWFSLRVLTPYRAVPVRLADVGGGVESGVVGESMQLDSPDPAETPQATNVVDQEQLERSLSAVTATVARIEARLDNPALDNADAAGGARTQGTGMVLGRGSGEGPTGFPRAQRWEIRFDAGASPAEYARQLDEFGIELGVVGFGGQVEYASQLASPMPQRRTGERADETRLYMSWRSGRRVEADRELLAAAGIDVGERIVVQFISPELEQQLAELERAYAGRQEHEIRRTIFGLRIENGRYAFYVIDQTY